MTLRRRKDEKANGRRIIVLPEKVVENVERRMTSDESSFYRQLESQSQMDFNKFVREGWRQNYHHILVSPHPCEYFQTAEARHLSNTEYRQSSLGKMPPQGHLTRPRRETAILVPPSIANGVMPGPSVTNICPKCIQQASLQ